MPVKIRFNIGLKYLLITFTLCTILCLALGFSLYSTLKKHSFEQFRERLKNIAYSSALSIDAPACEKFYKMLSPKLTNEAIKKLELSPEYKKIITQLNAIKETDHALILYVYILAPTSKSNVSKVIADADIYAVMNDQIKDNPISHFNDDYEISAYPELIKSLNERLNIADKNFSTDKSYPDKLVLSGYAPIFTKNKYAGTLCIDATMEGYQVILRRSKTTTLMISLAGVFFALIISLIFSSAFTRGIIKLNKVVNELGQKNFKTRIPILSNDELGQVCDSFNKMAEILENYTVELSETNKAYSRFVPHEYMTLLKKDRITQIQLGDCTLIDMTILFSDIRNFTSMSEMMTPKQNFDFINLYLSKVGPYVREHNGFIDKYVGDGIMALYPDKVEDAVLSAIAMQKEISKFNETEHIRNFSVKAGIGIHAGLLMLGTVGEHNRMDGSVISDAVNLSSRLQSLTKVYDASIIISKDVLNKFQDANQFNYRFLGVTTVKGKSQNILIYEVFDADPQELKAAKIETRNEFEKAVFLYQQNKFEQSLAIFNNIWEKNKYDNAVDAYIRKCEEALEGKDIDDEQYLEQAAKLRREPVFMDRRNLSDRRKGERRSSEDYKRRKDDQQNI